jgi:WD40 repeat protein
MYNPSYVWDAATGDPLFTLCYEGCWLGEWTPDPTRIVTLSSGTAAITLWDSQTGEIVHSLDLSEMSYYIDFPQWSPDGSRLVTSIENGALVWDAAAGTEPLILPHDGWVYSATWSPDGSKILTAAGDGAVRLWDATTGDLLQVMQHDDAVMGATWNADGTQILAWSRDGIVRVWDPATGTPIVQHEWPEHKWSGWHPQDNIVYSIIDDSTVSVWSTDTPQ